MLIFGVAEMKLMLGITSLSENAGGIVGYVNGNPIDKLLAISETYNYGEIRGQINVGGIVGKVRNY